MLPAAVYVRVSTEDQARHGYSLAAQADACRTRAESLGADQVQVFADEGVSGSVLSRPGLDAMREAVRSRSVLLVVVWDPDRLSRNLSHQLLLTEEIEGARVRLEFVNFEWKHTPEGQLFYALRGAIAQYEKEKIRERTGRGRLQKAKSGKLPAAFRPYGYDYDPVAALLVVKPPEADVVRSIYRWFLADGEGPGAIARRLTALSAPTRRGGPWHRGVVRQILMNPVYTGVFHANRWDTAGCSLNRHRPAEERVRPALRPEGEWVAIPVPSLVATEAWQEAQQRLEGARRLWAGRPRRDYLLSGLLTCGRCGLSMAGFAGRDWGVVRRKYSCRRSGGGAPAGARAWCGQAVPAEPLEEAVWSQVLGALGGAGALWEAFARPSGPDSTVQERAAVEEALLRAERGRVNLLMALEQGLATPADVAEPMARVRGRIAELTDRHAEVAARATGIRPTGERPDRATWIAAAEAWLAGRPDKEIAPADRRQLIRLLVLGVTVDRRQIVLKARWNAEQIP